MRLALGLGYAGGGLDLDAPALAQLAEECGYAAVWVAEAYGSDAASVLGWLGASTQQIGLGSAVFQIPGRTPAMTAMTAATLDWFSGGRMLLGLGVSGPQVSEGWHGVGFEAPLARTREYLAIVRAALNRELVASPGPYYPLPLPGGAGKALKLTVRRTRAHLPIYLAAVGPRNLRLAGEIADGWLGIFVSPEHSDDLFAALRQGRRDAGYGSEDQDPLDGFDAVAAVPVCIHDDLEAARARIAPHVALYVGGMGSRAANFYHASATRMGFGDAAGQIQELYLSGRPREAADAVPLDLVDAVALIGPHERIRERMRRYAAAGVTTLTVNPVGAVGEEREAIVRTMARLIADL